MPNGKKNIQRTKGNMRPSSSGRSAQRLMQPSGGHELTLTKGSHLGLVGLSSGLGLADDIDSKTLDENCRILLKKMTKKDVITKFKALQEFKTFCVSCTDEDMLSTLPYWPRLYNKLCLDADKRIREASNVVHARIIEKVKKNLAPHLKNVIGHWMIAMNDTYAPAASAAQHAFENAFSTSKQKDVLTFCKDEIMELVLEYLFNLTPQTLSDSESVLTDELEENYQRVVTCSMLALVTVVLQLSSAENEKLLETYNKIVSNGQFWKFGNHKTFSVRGAWLKIITAFSQNSTVAVVLDSHLGKLVKTVLSNLDENDPCVACAAWEANLQIITSYDECWKFINLKKALLPKLWKTLKQGCYGNASVVAAFLLPFISQLMKRIDVTARGTFYEDYFNSFREGLSSRSVRSSLAEFSSFATAFMECLKYVVVNLAENNPPEASNLLTTHLFPVIDAVLTTQTYSVQNTEAFGHLLASLLRSIHHQSVHSESRHKFEEIERSFWAMLTEKYLPFVSNYEKPDILVLENLCAILRCLAKCDKVVSEVKASKRIRFEEEPKPQKPELRPSTRSKDPLVTEKGSPLNIFVTQCCIKSMAGYIETENRSLAHLKFLSSVFLSYPSSWLLKDLVNFEGKEVLSDDELGKMFYTDIIKKHALQESNNEETYQTFSSLIFVTLEIVENQEVKSQILIDISVETAADNVLLIEYLSRQMKTAPLSSTSVGAYKVWLMSVEFTKSLMRQTQKLLLNEDENAMSANEREATWKLLSHFISHSVHHKCHFAEELIVYIFSQLFAAAVQRKRQNSRILSEFDRILKLLSEYMNGIKLPQADVPDMHQIVLLLFKFSCQAAIDGNFIDSSDFEYIQNLLSDEIKIILEAETVMKDSDLDCLKNCASYVHNLILNDDSIAKLSQEQLQYFGTWLQTWLQSITVDNKKVKGSSWDVVSAVLPSEDEWSKLVERLYQKVALDVLFRQKWTPSLKNVKDAEGSVKVNCDLVLALSNLTVQMLDTFMSSSSGERFLNQLIGLAGVNGYLRVKHDFGSKLKESFMKKLESQIWPNVLKSNLCRKFIKKCVQLAKTSDNYIWVEAASAVFAAYKKIDLDVYELVSDEAVRTSRNLLQACVHYRTFNVENFYSEIGDELKGATNALSTTDTFLKLKIFIKNVKLSEQSQIDRVINVLRDIFDKKIEVGSLDASKVGREYFDNPDLALELATFIDLLTESVSSFSANFDSDMWDYILVTLKNLIRDLCKSESSFEVNYLRFHVFCLLDVVSGVVSRLEESDSDNKMVVEWREFFSTRFYNPIINLLYLLSTAPYPNANVYVMNSMTKCLESVPLSTVENNELSPKLVSSWDENDTKTPLKVKYLLNRLCSLLISDNAGLRSGAFVVLNRVATAYPRYLQQGEPLELKNNDEDTDWYLPGAMVDILQRSSNSVSAVLKDYQFGEQVDFSSDSGAKIYSIFHGYLLAASLLFSTIGSGPSEWKQKWANALRNHGILYTMADHLFSIINENCQEGFAKDPKFIIERSSRKELENLACFVYVEALRRLPILVREWWNGLDRKSSTIVDKITSRFVTPKVISKDFQAVTEVQKLDNLSLLARPIAREVVATYVVDEVSFELVVQLAENHPLGQANIQCNRCIGVPKPQWNYWMLQLSTGVTQRNGSILDALALWKCHVDKMFEGAEECYVCYTILDSNFQLPKLRCSTCKKKFHSSCLFKWFNTSGHSSCPLCRSIF